MKKWTVLALFVLLPVVAVAQDPAPPEGEPAEDFIIGVGMAYDPEDFAGPARIEFLYEEFNMGEIEDGDVILEYRGFPVNSGAELHQLILSLPDIAEGDVVPMWLLKDNGEVKPAAPIAAKIVAKIHNFTLDDRQCVPGPACLCSRTKKGSTCIRTVTINRDANGKIVSTSASCSDGVKFCNTPPPKKGK